MDIKPITLEGRTRAAGAAGDGSCRGPGGLQHAGAVHLSLSAAGIHVRGLCPLIGYSDRGAGLLPVRNRRARVGPDRLASPRTWTFVPKHRGLEIGFTWIAKPHQGTLVNPECKYLLLRHAFDDQHAMRVQLKTDLRNVQSQGAIEKLGAVREGVLRKHIIRPDGYLRDTVMYSITAEEWPAVRAKLEQRLGYVP